MKIVVIADTHMPKKGKQLPSRLIQELDTTDLIIHAGDWSSMSVYHELYEFAPVTGVYGNVDHEDVKEHFPLSELLEISGHKIGITHGHGEKKTTEKRALEMFADNEVDVIIFGHSHIPMQRYSKRTLLLNPGSPTDKRWLPYYSFAILEIGEDLRAEMVFFKNEESKR